MQYLFSIPADSGAKNRQQGGVMLLSGVVLLVMARMSVLNAYPVGELFLGLGMLAAAPFNTRRLLAAGWLITLIGLAGFLVFGRILPTSQLLAVHVLAIGLGLLGIKWMTRRGFISEGTMTPVLLIVGVGIIEYLQAAHLTPPHFLSFALSLWFPSIGLSLSGLFVLTIRGRRHMMTKCNAGGDKHIETH